MPRHVAPLSDLVEAARITAGGFQALADRATATGTRLSLSYLHGLTKNTIERIPDEPHLEALAAAVRMPYEIVWLAAITQWLPPDDALVPALETQLERQLAALGDERTPEVDAGAAIVAGALRAIAAAERDAPKRKRPKSA